MMTEEKSRIMLDTNVLVSKNFTLDDFEKVYLSIQVLEELDGLKKAEGELGYNARKAIRQLEQATSDKVEYIILDNYKMPDGWSSDKRDNQIIMCAKNNNCDLISNDLNVRIKAKSVDVNSYGYENNKDKEEYTGYKFLEGNTEFINNFHASIDYGLNKYNLLENEYVIIKNTDLKKVNEYRYSNGRLETLVLPSSKVIKGMNSLQRCALDLLNNPDIPIKVITGTSGSGKSLLSIKVGLNHLLDKGTYKKIMLIRNPIGSGEEIGFLPGSKEEKIKDFFKPIVQHLDFGKFQLNDLINKDMLEAEIPFYMKGLSLHNTYMLVDEAEDLNLKSLKLIGTRVGNMSCVVFSGDYNQAEDKFKYDNGLLRFVNEHKGNPLVGVVVLEEDVRSEASKLFTQL